MPYLRFKRTGKRNEIFLASKFALQPGEDRDTRTRNIRGDREYVKAAAERTLERLGVGMIDLYYVHR